MSETQELLPKLRFPEFALAGKWLAKPLGKIAIFGNEKISVTKLTKANYISTENLIADFGGTSPSAKLPASGVVFGFRPHDILVSNIRPYLKKIWFSDKNGGASNDVMVIRSTDQVSSLYLALLLKRDEFINYMMKDAKGLKMPRGDIDSVKKYPIVFSSSEEQQKIADCLSSIDELIGAEGQKLDALKSYKKALMQQLFPRPERTENGIKIPPETTPRLRFPAFDNAPEWQKREVGDVFTITRGNVLAMTLVEEAPTERKPFPVYSSQTKRAGLAGYYSDFIYENAITWTTDGANAGEVNYRAGKFYCTNVCGVLISRDGYANACVAAIINSVSKNHVSYVGNPKLMNGVMAKIEVPMPSVEEQAKIALYLSSVDTLITAQGNKIETLRAHKKGLMQQLFPSVDEVMR